jgi:hypothetical protein
MNASLTNENLKISIHSVGTSKEPLLVIDDFLSEPEKLVKTASASTDWADVQPGGYPGLRAGLPRDYAHQTLSRVDPIIHDRLFKSEHKLEKFECSFSMVTRKPDALHDMQKIPHIDIASENRVAVLHYLCGAHFGGTAFFRQDETGLEQITPADSPAYLAARRNDLAAIPNDAGFPDAKTQGYTQTGRVEALFNRLVIYRSFTLHSGIIDAPERLTSDPSSGRLTANFFVDYVPSTCICKRCPD